MTLKDVEKAEKEYKEGKCVELTEEQFMKALEEADKDKTTEEEGIDEINEDLDFGDDDTEE